VIARPDPYTTPRDAYRDMAYQMATRGETVLWIAKRDDDGTAAALMLVPLAELNVEENTRNRLRPIYTWGNIKSTRYSPATPDGAFVHITYLKEPGALRGMGPLQMAGAATSVAVEAQEWAARFYAQGGRPTTELHTGMDLDADESEALLDQWTSREANMVQVTTGDLEVRDHKVNEQGAQMLTAREYNNGDAARLFGIPGMLMEYNSPGSSLTYQNTTEVWTSFAKGCLIPNYLEPIEQAFSDLQPRSIHLEFYTQGLLRADIKTRYDVYKTGIEAGVLTPENAQEMEGLIPGSPELSPVKPTPPASTPSSIPFAIGTPSTRMAAPIRCSGVVVIRGASRKCNRLLAESGPFAGTCPRCKKAYAAVA
jgi:HK97 family phage portal protein